MTSYISERVIFMTQCHVDSHQGQLNWTVSDGFRPDWPDFQVDWKHNLETLLN